MDQYLESLGLKPGASQQEIRDAYRDLVKVWHPDRFSNDPKLQKKAQEKLKEINIAYERLKDNRQDPHYSARPQSNDAPPRPRPRPQPSSGSSNSQSRQAPPRGQPSSGTTGSQSREAPPRQEAESSKRPAPTWNAERGKTIKYWRWVITATAIIALYAWFIDTNIRKSPTVGTGLVPAARKAPNIVDSLKAAPAKVTFKSAYTVQEGDTLTLIADAFKTTVEAVKNSNRLSSDVILVGQKLIIDTAEPTRIVGPLRRKTIVSKPSESRIKKNMNTAPETGRGDAPVMADKYKPSTLSGLPAVKPEQAINYITIGSSKDEVLAIQGTPSDIVGQTWWYGASKVNFSYTEKVIGYTNNGNLKVRLSPSSSSVTGQRPAYFTIGSSKDEVLAIQGTPSDIVGQTWWYGASKVNFSYTEKVIGYTNNGNLKIKLK